MRARRSIAISGAACIVSSLVFGLSGAVASGATTPGGTIRIFSDQSNDTNNGATGPIVITGAIGDYGTATSIDQNGKVDALGNYVKVVLKKGTFEINSVAFDAAATKEQPTVSSSNCSEYLAASGSVTLFAGTGAYKGIGGSLNVTVTFAGIGPKLKNGTCNQANSAQPLTIYGTITGSGTVTL